MAHVVVAMSGGVDSSVTAWLLKEQGHQVTGLFMRHGVNSCGGGNGAACNRRRCCSAADAADARRVADLLGIPFFALDFSLPFSQLVDYFVDEYTRGRTPNPCVRCNSLLKFGELFRYAESVGADYVATGHYARIEHGVSGSTPKLLRAIDPAKDQSYVLFEIDRSRLGQILLPLGLLTKSQVREYARQLRLPVAEKPDSQEVCFVPEEGHAALVRSRRPEWNSGGLIVTVDGQVVGRHEGIEKFTIGQRKGLGVALGARHYVVRIDPESHTVVVGPREALARRGLIATDANWLIDPPSRPFRCQVKIRYRTPPVEAEVIPEDSRTFRAIFDRPCDAVTPGQAAVCYDGDQVLGGGWILDGLDSP
ncbi:MAG: tRNA 2-thiouridine(34) synthase MnmA [Thermoguttaceae bacterium]|nr:tRNA 2-thiouridine(34) synthase MnmA [Thermoguttaceae bacterium]MDW8078012.1 tRNA 2-thiouridine(34) synthase MnmA [Thermoguttaceae bacterium]